ncbi:MAG TPA: mersacidin/lichenicidin family type 2 lantibiotic [Ktedonobacteraceae bacterium]|jgi:mersacidin/lichenicidin family type 2 lantibiotic
MSNIVLAWKDETYRQSLSVEEQAVLPANPAGEVELTDAALEGICGAWGNDGDRNKINQDVDQNAFATFGDKNFVIDSWVDCEAKNHADLDAKIKNKNFDI